jgi:hypothetical protein
MERRRFIKFSLDEIILFLWIVYIRVADALLTKYALGIGLHEYAPITKHMIDIFGIDLGLEISYHILLWCRENISILTKDILLYRWSCL